MRPNEVFGSICQTNPFGTQSMRIAIQIALTFCLLGISGMTSAAKEDTIKESPRIVYVGTYTKGESKGIYSLNFNPADATLTEMGYTDGIKNPSFLAINNKNSCLYAVSEIADFEGAGGAIVAYKMDKGSGKLTVLNTRKSYGSGPCFVSLDKTSQTLFLANYENGSVSSYLIEPDGSLSDAHSQIQHHGKSLHPTRQSAPHAHSINPSPDNTCALVADLGLDQIIAYKLEAEKGKLDSNPVAITKTPAGSGPRHLAFHPKGKFVYVCNELNSTVSSYRYDGDGKLTLLQTSSTLDKPDANNTTAEIQVHPTGRFLYCSNRGADNIAVFEIDANSGLMKANGHTSCGGKKPRNFRIDPSGQFLICANQGSDCIAVFRINQESGKLVDTGKRATIPTPVCIKFVE